jgi:aspartyl aminopeptidase
VKSKKSIFDETAGGPNFQLKTPKRVRARIQILTEIRYKINKQGVQTQYVKVNNIVENGKTNIPQTMHNPGIMFI